MPAEKPSLFTVAPKAAPAGHDSAPAAGPAGCQRAIPRRMPLYRQWFVPPVVVCALVMVLVYAAAARGFYSGVRSPDAYAWAFHPGWAPHQHMLLRWDAIRYWQIAKDGYTFVNKPVGSANTSWFPGYPLLGAAVAFLTGLTRVHALLLVSTLSAFCACLLVYRLTMETFPQYPDAPLFAVLGMLLQPVGVFFFSAYTEPLFVALSAGFFLLLSRRRFVAAALLGTFAGMVRPTGVVLGATLFFYLMFFNNHTPAATRQRRIWTAALLAALAVSGFIAHAIFLAVNTGDPLMILHIQRWVGVGLTPGNVWRALHINITFMRIVHQMIRPTQPGYVRALENACAVFTPVVLLAMVFGKSRLPWPMTLFAFLLWVLPFMAHSTLKYHGLARYVLATIAPLWVFGGAALGRQPRWVRGLMLALSGTWMLVLATHFAQGYWAG